MKAHIISIGNELLIGDTINTNASWIGRFLTEKGFHVEEIRTITDDYNHIIESVQYGFESADLIISTGGLGPTHDDVTKKAVADMFNSEMILNEEVLEHIKGIFRRRRLHFTRSNKDQALVPETCEVLFNRKGTAPGMWFEKNSSFLAVLPGVPHEMRHLMETGVNQKILKHFSGKQFRATRYLRTAGVSESSLADELVGDLSVFIRNGNGIAYLPSPSGVTIRASTNGKSTQDAENRLKPLVDHIREKAGAFIFGEGRDLKLSEVLGKLLSHKKLTLSAAESCTGGLLCNEITDIPGSSSYFKGGMIAYSNEIKMDQLGVPVKDLESYGAVSKQVSLQMAKGAAEKFDSDIGVSTTGIAGPDGGTKEKPVGTVWMGFYIDGQHFALQARFTNDRLINKERTVMVVLETLRRNLLNLDTIPYDLKPHYL
jgi:nicotinamide-nucleotide amidase